MAPTKGGTKMPTAKEAAVIAVVMVAGYWSWFGDHSKPNEPTAAADEN